MAKQFLDAAVETEKESIAKQDGTALTLTNKVRVLYDDTLTTSELYTLITRIRDRILQLEG
jgi:uncharacterized ubiquitin-like protein YukD